MFLNPNFGIFFYACIYNEESNDNHQYALADAYDFNQLQIMWHIRTHQMHALLYSPRQMWRVDQYHVYFLALHKPTHLWDEERHESIFIGDSNS